MMISGAIRFSAMMVIGSGILSLSACDAPSEVGRNETSTPGQNPPPDAFDRNWTLRFLDDLHWERARKQYSSIKWYVHDMTEFNADIEAKLLEVIPTLPEDNHDLILTGYEFLAKVQPDNPDYKDKVLHYTAVKQEFQKTSIAKLESHTDRIEGVTWYTHPVLPRYTSQRSGIDLYIGRVKNGPPTLRMQTQYTSKNWLFVSDVFAWHDGTKEGFVKGDFKRDHGSGLVWEWLDKKPTPKQIEILKSVTHSKEAILRYKGDKYTKDVLVSDDDKSALAEVLAAYESMAEEYEASKE